MKQIMLFLIGLVSLFSAAGCTTISHGAVSGRDISVQLERIAVGTSLQETLASLPGDTGKAVEPKRVGLLVYGYAAVDPTHEGESHMTMYRQYPRSVVLDLVEDDLVVSPKIADDRFQSGVLYIFFDKSKRFKGFLAYSHARYSMDKERLNEEKEAFKALGLVEEARRARRAIDESLKREIKRDLLPKLPLRSNPAR